jgi:hypothetical protein
LNADFLMTDRERVADVLERLARELLPPRAA